MFANLMKLQLSAEKLIYYLFIGTLFVMPMGTSPYTILGMCILAVWLFSGEFFRRRSRYLKESWFPPVAALILLAWLGLLWSYDPSELGFDYAKKTYYWLYAFALGGVGFSKYPADNLIKGFLGGLLINAFVAFLQLGSIVPPNYKWGHTYYTGLYSGYNTLAILLVLGMMTTSHYLRKAVDRRGKIIYASMMAAYFFHLLILEGRGGHLTFIVLSPFIIYNILNGKRKIVILGVYALVIAILFSSPIVRQRFNYAAENLKQHLEAGGEVTSGKKYAGYIDRIYMWRWAIDLFLENPFLGVGTGGYRKAILAEGGDMGIDHPHNNFLYMAVSFGILGLLVFIWFLWGLLRNGWRNRHCTPGFFILSSCLVILVGGMTDTHILDAGGAFLLAVTAGLQSALPKRAGPGPS